MTNFIESQVADIDAKIRELDAQRETLVAMKRAAQPQAETGKFTGIRDAIRLAIKSRPQGLTGKEIIQELRLSGDLGLYKGQVKPSVRVHNELYNLRKKDEIVRVGKRYRSRGPAIAFAGVPAKQ